MEFIKSKIGAIAIKLNQRTLSVDPKTKRVKYRALCRFHHPEKFYYQIQIGRRALFGFGREYWQDVTTAQSPKQVKIFVIDRGGMLF